MESELDIIDSLNALAYEGKCLQNDVLTAALEGGLRNADFRALVGWLACELHVLRKTDEEVSTESDDPSEFAMELSSLLKELGCPFNRFVTGALSERFETRLVCMQLLECLISELMTTKMCLRLRPAEKSYIIPKVETNTARCLEQISRELGLQKPPDNVSAKAYFDKLNFKLEERQRQVKPGVLCDALMHTNKPLTAAQWKKLEDIHTDLESEYNLRRQMLFTRLEVTIQSFQWSESMKQRENEILAKFQKNMQELEALKNGKTQETNIVALLAARSDLAIIEKTSSANVRKNTGSKIQKHVIGNVPDRGGRANEHAPPPPEMPSWQTQRAGPSAGGRGGGGGNFRGGRGGGSGGHWQQSSQAFEQRPQFEQGRDQNWVSGSGRVQGSGWSQRGNDRGRGGGRGGRGSGSSYQGDGGGRGGGSSNSQGEGGNRGAGGGRGGGNNYRGRSNYNRGGGGSGGGSDSLFSRR